MKVTWRLIAKSISAGIAIGIGGAAYLSTGNPWVFSIGLLMVCYFGLNLFTGKVSYFDGKDLPAYLVMWLYNTIAAYLMGILIAACKPELVEKASSMAATKLGEGAMIIHLAILCNIMIYVAVETRSHLSGPFSFISGVLLIFATTIFVICGFEHCIANAFYFGVAGVFSFKMAFFLLINAFWNAVGGIIAHRLIFMRSEHV